MADHLDRDIQRVIAHLRESPVDMRGIRIKPSISWVPIIVQVVSLIGIVGWAYGALDGRLTLIEYRLTQIEARMTGPHP